MSHVDESEIEASRAPLLDHLAELRTRLIVCVGSLVVGFILCFFFSRAIYLALLRPFEMAGVLYAEQKLHGHKGPFDLLFAITGLRPVTGHSDLRLVSTAPLEFFFTKMKLSGFGALMICFPVIAWQLYRFVAPGLYKKERNAFLPFLIAAPVLFLMGAALVYYVMLPFVLWFSLSQQIFDPHVQVALLPKVSDYLDLVTHMLLAFGLCFQLPVVLSLAALAGLVDAATLAKGRRYAILGIVVVAAVVTPPDPLSQCLLTIPIYGLYEVSIWCVRLIQLRRKREESRELALT
ncbi:twin-arginine translocase subunit TatC [Caulobacter sp. S45]|uniref:twin-arginine translocase subunit TatC n=1 Tax=Caulobacter sp. S45 TaxID=1641861 RepID=UPI001576F927|nr:twin-arginine translocase subunit TatC [Caulobacter sp. S45]